MADYNPASIDLTMDDDDENPYRHSKKQRVDFSLLQSNHFAHQTPSATHTFNHSPFPNPFPSTSSAFSLGRTLSTPGLPRQQTLQTRPQAVMPAPQAPPQAPQASSSRTQQHQIIDLTGKSPSPSPQPLSLFADLDPKTPACIGQLTVTALVLYPISYLCHRPTSNGVAPPADDWAPVRLQYDHEKGRSKTGDETIHIAVPPVRDPQGNVLVGGDVFGVVEQKVANALAPLLARHIIRLDGRVRRGSPNLPILPLELLVLTAKGNIASVAEHLSRHMLYLDHPTPANSARLSSILYSNPHNPPPGGFRNVIAKQGAAQSRWTNTVSGKSVEVQRSQVDELFKSLKTGDELPETEPASDVATQLYPHQKKALTFLLEREREITLPNGKSSSLWTQRPDAAGRPVYYNIVTQREVAERPLDCRGALLADDMGLGKTISCVALLASTLRSAREFGNSPLRQPQAPAAASQEAQVDPSHFMGSVWGMPAPQVAPPKKESAKEKAAAKRAQEEYVRACRLRARSRATLIVCPLSTVSNWEDQFREHWKGEVTVVGGGNSATPAPVTGPTCAISAALAAAGRLFCGDPQPAAQPPPPPSPKPGRVRSGTPLRMYIYHGNARRPDPAFLADFDVVITTYATLASEFSKQTRSTQVADDAGGAGAEEDAASSDGGSFMDIEPGLRTPGTPGTPGKPKSKKKKPLLQVAAQNGAELTSPLQMIHWFRVILDEAHSIKETSTVGCRASCDLMADRRVCLTGTPVQNKLDDVYALIKFLRLEPFDDKAVWTEYIGGPVKFGQHLGVARLQMIMKCLTLRRTKESKTPDGTPILSLPSRKDEVRYLKFDEHEQKIYDEFFGESKAEFSQMARTNSVMKNYVGILQKILRLRQICDHWQLVEAQPGAANMCVDTATDVDAVMKLLETEGLNVCRGTVVFALLRETGTAQCSECGAELATPLDTVERDAVEMDPQCIAPTANKRGRKSAPATRAGTPCSAPKPVITRCQHLYCAECFRAAVESQPHSVCTTCQRELILPADAVEVSPDGMIHSLGAKKAKVKREKRVRGAPGAGFAPSTKVRALLGDLVQFSRANPHSSNYDPATLEFEMMDRDGGASDDNVVKTVVFSQWTSMLDKIEDALEAVGIQYDRLDGTMKRDDRTKAMDALKHNPACEVLLVSLKAGGVGLNLTAAQRVYLMDPYWNPAVENQAVDRIHRLGQTKPVTTVKLIIENSIEARLLEVQKKKTALANMTLGQTLTKAELLQRRMEDLQELFG